MLEKNEFALIKEGMNIETVEIGEDYRFEVSMDSTIEVETPVAEISLEVLFLPA